MQTRSCAISFLLLQQTLTMVNSFLPIMPTNTPKSTPKQQEKFVDATFMLNLSSDGSKNQNGLENSLTTKATASSDTSSLASEESEPVPSHSLQKTLVRNASPRVLVPRKQKSYQNKILRVLPQDVETAKLENTRPWIVGHRGCLYDELENTREGFQRAAEMGADAVELDVFLLKCGTLIVFHGGGTDENPGHLLDYCSVDKGILDLDYSQALQLKFNPDFAEFGCPADKTIQGWIPTLEQVLMDAKESGLHVKVELKGPGTVEATLEVVERLGLESQVSYSCFDMDRIAHLRKLRPDKTRYPTGALFNDIPDNFLQQAENAGATEIHLRYDTCSKDIISQIHEAGFGSMAWFRGPIGMASDCQERFWDVGNEDESMYDAMLRTGVQQMCINRPDILVQYRRKLMSAEENGTPAVDLVEVPSVQPPLSQYNTTKVLYSM